MTTSSIEKNKARSFSLKQLTDEFHHQETKLKEGGGSSGKERQKRLNRLTVRERLDLLLDPSTDLLELGLWAGYKMYSEWGELPAAGVVTGIGIVKGRKCMIVANDATVKAGAMFPQSVKKVLRAQRIAFENRLPVIFLVDSSGVFLPMQEDVFPDEDDFGRIFRNNAIFSAEGIPQIAAIMGNCIAGGGYLPVLCDKLLMTEGSGLYIAGPALVKAAIGQVVETEELGGGRMHAEISGTVDFLEKDDPSCIKRLRALIDMLPDEQAALKKGKFTSRTDPKKLYDIVSGDNKKAYDAHALLDCILDADSMQEYKSDYGKTIITAYAQISGKPVGIIANQRTHSSTGRGEIEIGGVLYPESADKAARFIMDCNQIKVPIIFLHDVSGFMVGKEAEQAGIIRSGAKMISAMSNSLVPKITVLIGNSFGAGHYVMCGKAYDPRFIVAWPNAKYAVMGADQASDTLYTIQEKSAERQGKVLDKEEAEEMRIKVKIRYEEQMDIRYGAARGWVDAIIAPHETRKTLIKFLELVERVPIAAKSFHTGVFQV
ncbi:MAG: acyl-CoA carboxylase subunit beta [Parachlamydiaceae bacterium]|nr:acyl-CoA carboxylase subunit beta [Parachlamydiaceae bacterium]